MNAIELRPYQQSFIDSLRSEIIRGQRHICGVAPCGAGKTIMMGWMIREAVLRGKRCLFFVHRKELIDQTADTFRRLGIRFGVISSGYDTDYAAQVQIASVQTLTRRLDKITPPDFMICDECHHIKAKSYLQIVERYDKAWLIGVTATPVRTDGSGLAEVFGSLVESVSVTALIKQGHLAPFKYFAPTKIDVSNVRIIHGDYHTSELEPLVTKRRVVGDLVENYLRYAAGESALCYCVSVKHSKMVAEAFNRAGIPAAHCDCKTPKAERAEIIEDFRNGKIKVLCNVELFGEGVDVPNAGAVILARPTMSLTLYIQQAMRALRPDPNNPDKVAVIIDHVENYARHGLPDAERHWNISGRNKDEGVQRVKKCLKCGRVVKWGTRYCPNCGYVFPVLAKTTPYNRNAAEVEGELGAIYYSAVAESENRARLAEEYDKLLIKEMRSGNLHAPATAARLALKYAQTLDDVQYLAKRSGDWDLVSEWFKSAARRQ